jgi:hypothetical protein
MASTHENEHLPYRESLGTVPMRPGRAQSDREPNLDAAWMWILMGLGVTAAIVVLALMMLA